MYDQTSIVTQGLSAVTPSALITQGLTSNLPPPPNPLNLLENPVIVAPGSTPLAVGTNFVQQPNPGPRIYDPSGTTYSVPTPGGWTDMGGGYNLQFDPDTLQGRMSPALSPDGLTSAQQIGDGGIHSFTGSDLRIMIDLASNPTGNSATTPPTNQKSKQLIEAITLSVAVHRTTNQVRSLGYINPRGFSLGGRTIAGTIVLTQFTTAVLTRFLDSMNISESSKDSTYTKVDQLPPFNFTLIFNDEFGYASYQRLLGVRFVDDGIVYSNQDMYTEQTLSYLAADFTPLLPYSLSSLTQPAQQVPSEQTPSTWSGWSTGAPGSNSSLLS